MENRYEDPTIVQNNQAIMDICPAHPLLRIVTALELKKALKGKPDALVLDLGCGEGIATQYILDYNPGLQLEALDVSPEMIAKARERLSDRRGIKYIVEDASKHLRSSGTQYDAVVSQWTIHNFTPSDKAKLLAEIYHGLNSGGTFIWMDKIFPDDEDLARGCLERQASRMERYLPSNVAGPIVKHYKEDFTPAYRLTEEEAFDQLRRAGFHKIKLVDRVESDAVIVAEKGR